MISVGNFLVNSEIKNFNYLNKKKYLLVLPILDIYKRSQNFFYNKSNLLTIENIEFFLNNLSYEIRQKIHLRMHPKESRKDFSFSDFISFNKKKIKILDKSKNFSKISKNYSLQIFLYLSTEFMNCLTLDVPCIIYLNKVEITKFKKDAKELLFELHSVGIVHFSGLSMAKNLKKISKNINKWWNDKEVIKIKKKFCYNYCNTNFNYKKMLIHLKS